MVKDKQHSRGHGPNGCFDASTMRKVQCARIIREGLGMLRFGEMERLIGLYGLTRG